MASTCFNKWVVYQNSKGHKKWVNEGPAPDGACPSCPEAQFPAYGTWNGVSARCLDGAIVKLIANGYGGLIPGGSIVPSGTPKAQQACYNNSYIGGPAPITSYFP